MHNSASTPEPLLLSQKQAAKLLNISERTLWTLSNNGDIPRLKIGTKTVRYRMADLHAWVDRQAELAQLAQSTKGI